MFPALLSLAEVHGCSGRDLVTAAIISFDVCSRLVRGGVGIGVQHGINTCTWWGVPATAAGASRLLGLDHEQTANAMSIALSQSSGLGHQTGFDAHKLEAGHSCRAGITAALLAAEGATGAPAFVDDTHLAFAVVRPDGTADPAAVVRDLGNERSTVHQVEFKKYPGCGLLHASVDAVTDLIAEHGLTAVDIESVETVVSRHTAEYCDRPHPATLDSARWSFSFALAEVLLHGGIGLRTFADPDRLTDPRHRATRDKVHVVVDPALSTGFSGARVQLLTTDGRTLAKEVETFRGHPDDPLTPDEIVVVLSPFLDAATSPRTRDRIVDLVMGLDDGDAEELMQIVTEAR
jgi:2-methylcitrate dehydratase PrpD